MRKKSPVGKALDAIAKVGDSYGKLPGKRAPGGNIYYVLDKEKNPIISDGSTFYNRYGDFDKERRIAYDKLKGLKISTVFLGIDHSFGKGGHPVLFETMIFKGGFDEVWCRRTCTYREAQATHAKALKLAKCIEKSGLDDVAIEKLLS